MNTVEIVSLSESNLERVQMFCGHSPTYRKGYRAKQEWMQARLREGMRYLLLQVNGYNAGMVEYIPGEHAWRGLQAEGYLVIHCLWVIGRNRGHGYGRQLLDACLEDARGTHGVAVMVSKSHWLPTPKLFLKNGFEKVAQHPPSFDLLVKRLDPAAPMPAFINQSPALPAGLVVYISDQCPYTQNVPEIASRAAAQLNVDVQIIQLEGATDAQACPCPYGSLAYFFNGQLLTYHPTGTEKLLELIQAKMGLAG